MISMITTSCYITGLLNLHTCGCYLFVWCCHCIKYFIKISPIKILIEISVSECYYVFLATWAYELAYVNSSTNIMQELMERLKTPSDPELMQIAIADLNNSSLSLEDRKRALDELLILVEPIDNANGNFMMTLSKSTVLNLHGWLNFPLWGMKVNFLPSLATLDCQWQKSAWGKVISCITCFFWIYIEFLIFLEQVLFLSNYAFELLLPRKQHLELWCKNC